MTSPGISWTRAILGAVLAFVLALGTSAGIVTLQVESAKDRLPPDAAAATILRPLRRALVGFYLHAAHLMPLRISARLTEFDTGFGELSATAKGSLAAPLAGLLLLPALSLLLGGFAAAAGPAGSGTWGVRQGAAIAVPYTVLLLATVPLLAFRLDGLTLPPTLPGPPGERIPLLLEIRPGLPGLVVFGALWSALFGALGGVWAGGGGVRRILREFLVHRLGRWAPGAYGAGVALVVGLMLTGIAGAASTVWAGRRGMLGAIQPVGPFPAGPVDLVLGVLEGPPSLAVLGYPLVHGVPGVMRAHVRALTEAGGAPVATARGSLSLPLRTLRYTLLEEEPSQRSHRLPWWVLLGLGIPLVALAVGGRAAAGMQRAQPPLEVGLALGAVYAAGVAAIWYFGRMGFVLSVTTGGAVGVSGVVSLLMGPPLLGTILAGVLWGTIVGTAAVAAVRWTAARAGG